MKKISADDIKHTILPNIQKVKIYMIKPSFLQDILKHTPRNHHDREHMQEGLTGIENVAHQLNEGKRHSEQKFHGQEILAKLSARLQPDKKAFLIRQDDVKQISEVKIKTFIFEIHCEKNVFVAFEKKMQVKLKGLKSRTNCKQIS